MPELTSYDTIVVGGGSAGCVVAARLSEDPARKVLLIEAGGSGKRPEVRIPAAFFGQFKTAMDWDYNCEPERAYNNRVLDEPRGRMLGGSSSMNLMLYIRGHRRDYDGWAEQGAAGWAYEDVLPYFRKSERNEELFDDYHGTDGPLNVTTIRSHDPLSDRWIEAAMASGIPFNRDFNGAEQDGVGRPQVTQRRGARADAASAFLRPVLRRPNLTVLTGALVNRVELRNGRAVAVEYIKGGRPERAYADGQIVLCGGVFGSAEILQRSGIGPADHLRSVGVQAHQDLPAVGANLAEHPLVSIQWELADGLVGMNNVTGRNNMPRARYLAQWLIRRNGKLSSNIGESLAHVRSDPGLDAPDFQLLFAPVFFAADGRTHPVPAITMGASYLTPSSRGTVRIASADPSAKATVVLNLLSQQREVDDCLWALQRLQQIAAEPTIGDQLTKAILPGHDRASLLAHLRQTGAHTFHASGTVRMGAGQDSAVDERLRVHGVEGLRVADASVFPVIPRGNTNAPTVMVAERCADFIREDDKTRTANGRSGNQLNEMER